MKHYENAKEIWSQPHTVFLYKVGQWPRPFPTCPRMYKTMDQQMHRLTAGRAWNHATDWIIETLPSSVKPSQPVLTVLDSAADSVNVSWGSSSHGRCRLRYRANSTYMWTQVGIMQTFLFIRILFGGRPRPLFSLLHTRPTYAVYGMRLWDQHVLTCISPHRTLVW